MNSPSTPARRALAAFLLALTAGVVLTACGGARNAASTGSRGAVVSMIVTGNADEAATNELAVAQYLLVSRCMSAHGFHTLAPATPPPSPEQRVSPLLSNGGDIVTVPSEAAAIREAQEWGYGITARRDQGHQVGSQSGTSTFRSTPPAKKASQATGYTVALTGHGVNRIFTVPGIAQHTYPTEGCSAKGLGQLYGSPLLAVQATYLPEDLNLAVTHQVLVQPEFHEAAARWSACLAKGTGLRARSPYEVTDSLLTGIESHSGPATPAERAFESRVAVADTRCQYSTGLVRTAAALRRHFAESLSGPYEGLLVTLLEVRARASRNAESVLSQAGR